MKNLITILVLLISVNAVAVKKDSKDSWIAWLYLRLRGLPTLEQYQAAMQQRRLQAPNQFNEQGRRSREEPVGDDGFDGGCDFDAGGDCGGGNTPEPERVTKKQRLELTPVEELRDGFRDNEHLKEPVDRPRLHMILGGYLRYRPEICFDVENDGKTKRFGGQRKTAIRIPLKKHRGDKFSIDVDNIGIAVPHSSGDVSPASNEPVEIDAEILREVENSLKKSGDKAPGVQGALAESLEEFHAAQANEEAILSIRQARLPDGTIHAVVPRRTPADGDCGFHALDTTRADFVGAVTGVMGNRREGLGPMFVEAFEQLVRAREFAGYGPWRTAMMRRNGRLWAGEFEINLWAHMSNRRVVVFELGNNEFVLRGTGNEFGPPGAEEIWIAHVNAGEPLREGEPRRANHYIRLDRPETPANNPPQNGTDQAALTPQPRAALQLGGSTPAGRLTYGSARTPQSK